MLGFRLHARVTREMGILLRPDVVGWDDLSGSGVKLVLPMTNEFEERDGLVAHLYYPDSLLLEQSRREVWDHIERNVSETAEQMGDIALELAWAQAEASYFARG